MLANQRRLLLLALLVAVPLPIAAGETRTILDLFKSPDDIPAGIDEAVPAPAAPPRFGVSLPIRASLLTPGREPDRALPLVGNKAGPPAEQRPLLLIGADRQSLGWLHRWQEELLAIGAVGLVVQAETEGDLVLLNPVAAGVPIFPVAGDAFAQELGVAHYPVLISARGITTDPTAAVQER